MPDISLLACANDRKHEVWALTVSKPDQDPGAPSYIGLGHRVTKLGKPLIPEILVSLLDRGQALIDLCYFGFVLFNR